MECYGISDIGMRRNENQDTFAVRTEGSCTVAVVCDGMGGAAGGRIAAETACARFIDEFFNMFDEFCKTGDMTVAAVGISRAVRSAVRAANKEVYDKSKEDKKLSGMGTTLVGAVFYDGMCYACNVGDSRMYQFDEDKTLSQITKDHTYIEFLIEKGTKITKRMEKHEKGVITRALGPDEKVVPDVYVFEINEGDIYLLCSDGLYNMIGNDGIENELLQAGEKSLDTLGREFIDRANYRGGKDNITAVIIKI